MGIREWFGFGQGRTADASPRRSTAREIEAAARDLTLRNLPKGRLSQNGSDWEGLFQLLEQTFKGYPDQPSLDIIEALRKAAQADDDVSGALRDLQALVNTGFGWEFVAGSRATKQAEAELDRWGRVVYPGGLHVLVQNQVRELYTSVASSVEWVPDKTRREVAEAVVVPGETVRPIRDKETGRVVFEQQHSGANLVRLNPLTYRYQPLETEGEYHSGIPVAIAAPATLARKTGIFAGVQKIINLMADSVFLDVKVPRPEPSDFGFSSEQDPGWEEAKAAYYSEMLRTYISAKEHGIALTPEGVETDATPLTQNVTGARDIMELNQKGVWNAAATLPFYRGDMSANYALAKVVRGILVVLANNMQKTIALQLEHGANLHLRLMGISAEAYLVWEPRDNPFAKDDADAEKVRMETDELGMKLFGRAYARKAMQRQDIADEDFTAAPEWWDKRNDPPGGKGDDDA